VSEGRELVATFQFDAAKELFPLYARSGSEIIRSDARHIVFATPKMWVGGAGAPESNSIAGKGNAWNLPASGFVHFAVDSPGPPTCMFSYRIIHADRQPPDPGDAEHLTVRSKGVELYSAEILAGASSSPVRVTAPARTSDGRYEFEFECRYTGSSNPESVRLKLGELLVRYGDPLESKDFKLGSRRTRDRIDYVAGSGLPNALFGN
jgi:hypothetical protein